MGTLYLVSTPIGNLEDITIRALRILRSVPLIAAEDTRHTRILLHRYDISTSCISYHEQNKLHRIPTILRALEHGDVALVSDAGTPLLSDPGYELVSACITAHIPISPIPGPSAMLAALTASGLPTNQVFFLGFLPPRSSRRRTALTTLASLAATLVCFEAPHRLAATLHDIMTVLGDRRIVVARELTKHYEEFVRGTCSDVLTHFTTTPPRGECTIVIEPLHTYHAQQPNDSATHDMAFEHLRELHAQGMRGSDAARLVAQTYHIPKRVAYQLWLSLDDQDS